MGRAIWASGMSVSLREDVCIDIGAVVSGRWCDWVVARAEGRALRGRAP